MDVVEGYFDYCISESCVIQEDFKQTAKLLSEWGYRTIAVNQILDETNLEQRKKKKKGEPRDNTDVVPVPIDVKKYQDNTNLRILNRLTIVFSNADVFNKISKSPNYKKYHIIAIMPMTQAAIQFACVSVEADILSYDPESRISYKLSRRLYNQVVEKGLHFEILYSPAIQDSANRKNMIHVSHLYHSFGKSKNIIISSGAPKRILLRQPADVRNLGFVFGLNEELANNSILSNGRKVYLNSFGRRRGKTFVFVEEVTKKIEGTGIDKEDIEVMETDGPAPKKHKQ